jgi:hypothetical protein
MKKDPIVEEVRKNRAILAKKHGGDIRNIVKNAQKRQKSSKRRVISFTKY